MPRSARMLLLGVFLVAPWAATAQAEDWSQWGGTDSRNMISPAKGLPTSFVPGKKRPNSEGIDPATTQNVKWTVALGSQTYGNPTIAGGKVFVGTNDDPVGDPRYKSTGGGVVKCFDEATGKLLWQLVCPRRRVDIPGALFDHLALGVCSSPTVEGDRVYLVTSRSEVMCLDTNGLADGNGGPYADEAQYAIEASGAPVQLAATDPDVIWRFDMIEQLPSCPQDAPNCSILIHGDLLYVCTSNGVDQSHDKVIFPQAPSLIVLDKHTGRLVAVDDEKIGTRLFHGQWSSPSLGKVGDKTLVFFGGGDGLCYAFEALPAVPSAAVTLKKVWSYDCNPPEYKITDGKPINYRDGDKRRNAGNRNDGTFLGPSEIIATPVFYHNRVYVAIGQDPMHGNGKGLLHCIDAAKTGDITTAGKIWSYDKIQRSLSTVAIADGLLYVADVTGALHCLDPDTGKCLWVHETKDETWASPFVADGKIYLGTRKCLVVMAAGPEAKLLGEINLGAPVWCTPVVANGVLYVASQRRLWAVQETSNP